MKPYREDIYRKQTQRSSHGDSSRHFTEIQLGFVVSLIKRKFDEAFSMITLFIKTGTDMIDCRNAQIFFYHLVSFHVSIQLVHLKFYFLIQSFNKTAVSAVLIEFSRTALIVIQDLFHFNSKISIFLHLLMDIKLMGIVWVSIKKKNISN